MSAANHLLHAVVSRQHIGIRLECLPGPGHVSVNREAWTLHELPELEAQGLVDHSRCWVQDWLENDGVDCIDGDNWPEDGPWAVCCYFNGDGMFIEHAGGPGR